MNHNPRNLRKAAVLVASLDDRRADEILAQMSAGQAEAVRQAVARLGHVHPDEQREVIEEFIRLGPLVPDHEPSGIELTDPRCATFATAHTTYTLEHQPAYRLGIESPSDVLDEASAETLAAFLAGEQPQTVAVFVSHLPSQRAADVLAALPDELQIDVARRVVELEETDPEVLREIERGLAARLAQLAAAERRRTAGLSALGSILQAVPSGTRRHILAGLGHHDREIPAGRQHAAQPPMTFSELEQLDGKSLGVVLRQAHGELLVLALAGAARNSSSDRCRCFHPPRRSCFAGR